MWFKVTWASGAVAHMDSETQTPAALAMERWGHSLEEVEALGVRIEHAIPGELAALGLVHVDAPEVTPEPAATSEMEPSSETQETTESTPSAPEAQQQDAAQTNG
jgi:hypothetical protein